MREFIEALKKKDCEKVLELLDSYLEEIESEEELKEVLKKLEELAVDCESYDLAHEIAHIYVHLEEEEKGLKIYERIVEKAKDDEAKYTGALYYLADAYDHFGFPDKAIGVYKKLLEIERQRRDKKEEALTLAHMAIIYEELGDVEKAIELMEKAKGLFYEMEDNRNYLTSLVDLAHFYYEEGDVKKAKELIDEVLKSPRESEIEINARLVSAEIDANEENYRKAFKEINLAMLKGLEINEELFLFAFETLLDFLKEMFSEKLFKEIHKNVDIFVNSFEDLNKEYALFFKAIGELARFKEGEEKAKTKFEELYNSIENEELREVLDEFKKTGATFLSF
jgi:tetratricopeptide (TPR) repeat protein